MDEITIVEELETKATPSAIVGLFD